MQYYTQDIAEFKDKLYLFLHNYCIANKLELNLCRGSFRYSCEHVSSNFNANPVPTMEAHKCR